MNKQLQIISLVNKLQAASKAYYAGDYNSEYAISDAHYDMLEAELRSLDSTNPFLRHVGAPVDGAWNKVRHTCPMGSLSKAQNQDEFNDWWNSCRLNNEQQDELPLAITMRKCDGASISLKYVNGYLVSAVTRGDGEIGEDITRNVLMIKGIVRHLNDNWFGHVRGEILIKHDDFTKHFSGGSNPRNVAAGTMKRQSDADNCRFLSIVCYEAISDHYGALSKHHQLIWLEANGFETAGCWPIYELSELYKLYDSFISHMRSETPYDIDGLVIEVNDSYKFDNLGETNGRPKGAIAYKFPHDSAITTLRSIEWQVGPSGRITPVAVFDTIELAGAMISRASLHNASNIQRLIEASVEQPFISPGSKILVSRRNDVIPCIEALVLTSYEHPPFEMPMICPVCSAKTHLDGEYIICRNNECSAQVAGGIRRWVQKIGVLHFGESLIEALIEAELVHDISDLYNVDIKDAESLESEGRRFGGSALRAFTDLRSRMTLDLHVVVGSLGIPLVGRSTVKTLVVAGFNTLEKLQSATELQLAAVSGIGPARAASFVSGLHGRAQLLSRLLTSGICITGVQKNNLMMGSMSGKSMCVTGFRDVDLTAKFEAAGGEVKTGVSSGLTYLVCKDPLASSGKLDKAKKLGVKLLTINDMLKLLASF